MFKPVAQRAAVAAAGPFANFLLAIVLLTGLFIINGHAVVKPVIGEVTPGSPAAQARASAPATWSPGSMAPAIIDFQQLPQIIGISGGDTLQHHPAAGRRMT